MRSGAATPRSKFKIQTWHIGAILVCITLAGLYHGMNVVKDSYTVKPLKVYEEAFENPPNHVTDLTGGGTLSGNFDIWLHFKCPTNDMKLKKESLFQKILAEQGRRWFEANVPDQAKGLEGDINRLELYYGTWRTATTVSNYWLLHNKATADYYYRSWGY
jgi:hypothetical protein